MEILNVQLFIYLVYLNGLELVGISCVTSPEFLAIGNQTISLCIANIKKIGQTQTNDNIKSFHKYLNKRSACTCKEVKEKIGLPGNSEDIFDGSCYDSGCKFLLSWYNSLK